MLLIILKNLILVACIYGAYKVSKSFFYDDQKLLRILATFILAVVFFGLANGVLSFMTPGVNVEKQLQKEAMFVSLKQKNPQEYQSIVEEVTLEAKLNDFNENEVVAFSQQKLALLAFKLVAKASDDSRYEFIKSYSKSVSLLKNQGGTLCYDMMFNQNAVTSDQEDTVSRVFKQSGMNNAILTIINDNKVDKAVASQRDMDKMEEQILRQLIKKHAQDINFLTSPKSAVSVENKQTVCQVFIDLYELMNDFNSKVKRAVLRRNMQNISSGMATLDLKRNNVNISPSPQMAEPAF